MLDLYEQHLDEAAWLWYQWERALDSPLFTLEGVSGLEERLLAHVDALLVGEDEAQTLLRPALKAPLEPARLSAATFAWIADSGPAALELLLSLVDDAPDTARVAYRQALELSGRQDLDAALVSCLRSPTEPLRTLALAVLRFRGTLHEAAALELLHAEEPHGLLAALRSLHPLPAKVIQQQLPRWLVHERVEIRLAAIEAGLAAGSRAAWEACYEELDKRQEGSLQAAVLLALLGDEKDLRRLLPLLGNPSWCPYVVWALGFSGRRAAAEACLELMALPPPLSGLAGEAFGAITGLRLTGAYLRPAPPQDEALPSLEEDLKTDLMPRPENDLPLPEPQAVARWWHQARQHYEPGTRYMQGLAFSGTRLVQALEQESMRRRHVLALELRLRSGGSCNVQTRALSRVQRTMLSQARAKVAQIPASTLERTFTH